MLGKPQRVGIRVNGSFSWLSEWNTQASYSKGTIITDSTARNKHQGIEISIRSCVHCTHNVFLRKITVHNNSDVQKDVKLMFEQDYDLYGNKVGDTAAYRPEHHAVVHYNNKRYISVDVTKQNQKTNLAGYGVYSNGVSEEDFKRGSLNQNPVAQGNIASAVSYREDVNPGEQKTAYYRLRTGTSFADCFGDPKAGEKPQQLFSQTEMCWKGYLGRMNVDISELPNNIDEQFKRSILVILGQTNENGSITAANDSTNLEFNQDKYGYVWPRDAALVSASMSRAGYGAYVKEFFNFVGRAIEDEGYLLHKYNPNGSLGSSWHQWVDSDGSKRIPIQEDETALPIWALNKYFEHTGDKETLRKAWSEFGRKASDFIHGYFNESSGLPKPSYDLWEERYYTSAFTTSAVYAGLKAASKICAELGEDGKKYRQRAQRIKDTGLKNLRSEDTKRYVRGIDSGTQEDTVSAALLFLQKFGLTNRKDEYFENTLNAIRYDLTNGSEGGIARYKGDSYHQISSKTDKIPGNPWTLCTLWLGRTLAENPKTDEDPKKAMEKLNWVSSHSTSTGLLPEQVNPLNGEPVSVSPLTWSHAAYIDTAISVSEAKSQLEKSER